MDTTFENVATSITYNGYDLRQLGLQLTGVRGRGTPNPQASVQQVPGRDGQRVFDVKHGPRPITCRGRLVGSDRDDLFSMLDALKHLLSASARADVNTPTVEGVDLGAAQLIFHDQADRFWPVRYGRAMQLSDVGRDWANHRVMDVELSFICDMPFAIGVDYEVVAADCTHTTRTVERLLRLPNGTAPMRPQIELIGDGTANPSVIQGELLMSEDFDNDLFAEWQTPQAPANLLTDGDMEASGTSSWTAIGSISLSKTSVYVHGGTQSLEVTAGAANAGVKQTYAVAAGEDYCLSYYYRCASSDAVKVQAYDETGAAVVTEYVEAASTGEFRRGFMAFEVPTGSTSISVRFLGTAAQTFYLDDVYLMANKLNNGGMEGAYVSGVAPGWTNNGATCTEEAGPDGTKAQGIFDGSATKYLSQTWSGLSGKYYAIFFKMKRHAVWSGDFTVEFDSYMYPLFHRFYVTDDWNVGVMYAWCGNTGTRTIKLYNEPSAMHYIADIAVVELADDTTHKFRAAPFDSAYEMLPGRVLYASPVCTQDAFSVALFFNPDWTSSHPEANELFHFSWNTRHFLSVQSAGDRFRVHYAYGGSNEDDITGAVQTFTTKSFLSLIAVVDGAAGKLRLYVDGVQQDEVATGYTKETTTPYLACMGPAYMDHVAVYLRALTDAEAADVGRKLARPVVGSALTDSDARTLTYTGAFAAGDRIHIDCEMLTAKKIAAAGGETDILADMSGQWPEITGREGVLRAGAKCRAMRARYRKRWI